MAQKLYTEEQVRKAIEFARDTHQEGRPYLERDVYDYSYDEIINMLTPIELPSDDDIEKQAPFGESTFGFEQGQYQGFIVGAKWMKQQILKKNK